MRWLSLLVAPIVAASVSACECHDAGLLRRGRAYVGLTIQTTHSCAVVQAEATRRASHANGWLDPHHGGTYTVVPASSLDHLRATRLTANGRWTDDLSLRFVNANAACVVHGCSTSRVLSVVDFSTNFCNLVNLVDGDVTVVNSSFAAGADPAACRK